ncbi:MAG: hypothetical protein NPIRA04_24160 [Nitrospirales bacterium]|nr:MAG: hypothetical protein NPIRA04_24160 [Nitrospirales bacterium]
MTTLWQELLKLTIVLLRIYKKCFISIQPIEVGEIMVCFLVYEGMLSKRIPLYEVGINWIKGISPLAYGEKPFLGLPTAKTMINQ